MGNSWDIDFFNPVDNVKAFVKMRGDLNPEKAAIGWYGGTIYSVVGQYETMKPLCRFEGFGISVHKPIDGGAFQHIHKEVVYYKDFRTNQIIDEWDNVLTGEKVKVYHTHNDPVNSIMKPEFEQVFGDGSKMSFPFLMEWTTFGDDAQAFMPFVTRWPSLIKVDEWPRESPGSWVRVGEFLQTDVKLSQLKDESLTKVPYTGCWYRIGPWLPWMLMDQKEGHLFYAARTHSIDTIGDLPKDLLAFSEKNYPSFLEPEFEWKEPNVTSFETFLAEATPQPPRRMF